MFDKLKRKPKEPEVIHIKYDIVPPFNFEGKTDKEAKAYFESLSRVQLLEAYDRDDYIPDKFWDEYYTVLNEIASWPSDEDMSTAMNKLYWNSDSIRHKVPEMEKQIAGMQKKLDRITTLLENTEFKLCGKDAMKL